MALFAAVLLAGCTPTVGPTASAPVPSPGSAAPGDPAWAFALDVGWLYDHDPALNGQLMAVDAASSGLPDPDSLMRIISADPRYASHQVRMATRSQLQAEGRMLDGNVTDGFLIEFANSHVGAEEVTTDATKYAGNTGASGARLTAKRLGEGWVLQEPTMRWAA